MTTHEPTVYDNTATTPRYQIDWHGKTPQPGDTVLMSVELFEECINILNRENAGPNPSEVGPIIGYHWKAHPESTLIAPNEISIIRATLKATNRTPPIV